MISSKIENAIIKYLNRSASMADMEMLEAWIQDPENEKVFKDYVLNHYAINYSLSTPDAHEAVDALLDKINIEKSVFYRKRVQSVLKYAAIVIISLGIGYVYQNDFFSFNTKDTLVIPDAKIILVLENGDVEHIDENVVEEIADKRGNIIGSQQGNQLSYAQKETNTHTVYNTINVPYGKKFNLKLTDGTLVHLNAGTQLKYPVDFVEGKKRKVFLKGEAYFEVAKDEKHPFIVSTNEIDVRVLGTQFNVSAYEEDKELSTVLVEGSVRMYNTTEKENGVLMAPNQMATWHKFGETIEVAEVDVTSHISWVKGRLVFRNTMFSEIIKRLERHYNVEIINNNILLDSQYYDATFDVESIEEVLESFNKSYAITYSIVDNKVIIN